MSRLRLVQEDFVKRVYLMNLSVKKRAGLRKAYKVK